MGSVWSSTESAASPHSHLTPPPVIAPILISPPSSRSHPTPSTQPPRSSFSLSSSSSPFATRVRSPFTSSRHLFVTPRHTIMSSPITSSEPEATHDDESPELIARGKPISTMHVNVTSTQFQERVLASPTPSESISIGASGTESPSPSVHDAAEKPKGTMKCEYCDQPLVKEKLYGAGRFCNVKCCKAHAGRASSRAKHEKAAKRGKRRTTTTTTTTSTKRIKHTNDIKQDVEMEMKQDTVSIASTSASTLPVVMSSSASALVTTSLPSLPSLSTTELQLGDADTTGQALFQRASNLRSTIDTLTVTSQQHDANVMNLQQELVAIQQRIATEQTTKQQIQTELASTQAAYQSMYQTCMTYQQSRASFLQIIQQVQQTLVDEEE